MKVNIYEAKTNFSKLLEKVQQGEEVIIAKAGKPLAELRLHRSAQSHITFGTLTGQLSYKAKKPAPSNKTAGFISKWGKK